MSPILDGGVRLIVFLQSLGTWLIAPMQFFSFLGNEEFFLLIMPIVYWCVDSTAGLRAGFLLLSSGCINDIFKIALHTPRPYWISTQVHAYSAETSFGLPSGHAQKAVAVWGGLAASFRGASFRRKWGWILVILLIFLIGVSRLVLAVHFPIDVLAGWILGAILLAGFLAFETPVKAWFHRRPAGAQVMAAFGLTLLPVLVGALVRLSLGAWTTPQAWIDMAAAAAPGAAPINPLSLGGMVSDAGALFGLALGVILLPLFGGFRTRGEPGKLVLRFIVGLVGVLFFWRLLDMVFPGEENLVGFLFRYLRYALTGFWITGLAPVVFTRTRLAEPARPEEVKVYSVQ